MEEQTQAAEAAGNESSESSAFENISPQQLASLGIEPDSNSKVEPDSIGQQLASEEETLEPAIESNETEEDHPSEEPEATHELKHDGVTRNLTKEEYDSYARKGFDYTVKTQTLADDRKSQEEAWKLKEEQFAKGEESFKSRSTEMEDALLLNSRREFYLESLAKTNPDLYEEIDNGFREATQHFSNPMIDSQMEKMNRQIQFMEDAHKERENNIIIREYESGYKEAEAKWKDTFDKYGLKMDESKVRQAYVNGAETPEKALLNVYGGDIIKLMNSGNKTEAVKKKVASQKKVVPTTSKKSIPEVNEPRKPLQKQSWNDLEALIKQEHLGF